MIYILPFYDLDFLTMEFCIHWQHDLFIDQTVHTQSTRIGITNTSELMSNSVASLTQWLDIMKANGSTG